jgi:galactokinase/mevalonate kinase-like predicted kinase
VRIETSAPTRIDLAGGTIDIWPLYLFHPGALTINAAISVRARARVESRDDLRLLRAAASVTTGDCGRARACACCCCLLLQRLWIA